MGKKLSKLKQKSIRTYKKNTGIEKKDTGINDLPEEILLEIFGYLNYVNIQTNITKVCKRWKYTIRKLAGTVGIQCHHPV